MEAKNLFQQIQQRIHRKQEQQIAEVKKASIKTLPNSKLREAFEAAAGALLPADRYLIVDKENQESINQLLYYFNGDENFDGVFTMGVMLQGNVGSGKSLLMRIFQLLSLKPFVYKPCREIGAEVMDKDKGYTAIKEYSKAHSKNNEAFYQVYCFDDLGAESNLKSFGNEINVMAEIIQDRYERWKSFGTVTHFTTNLSKAEILERYGDRVCSRLEEMCNFIVLGNGENSTDRRTGR